MDKKNYKWLMLAFLFGAYFLEQASRQVYSATLPQIKQNFLGLRVTDALLGSVGMAPLVLGWISDRSSMREAMMSLGWFYLAGALILVPAILWYFRIDFIPNQEETR